MWRIRSIRAICLAIIEVGDRALSRPVILQPQSCRHAVTSFVKLHATEPATLLKKAPKGPFSFIGLDEVVRAALPRKYGDRQCNADHFRRVGLRGRIPGQPTLALRDAAANGWCPALLFWTGLFLVQQLSLARVR